MEKERKRIIDLLWEIDFPIKKEDSIYNTLKRVFDEVKIKITPCENIDCDKICRIADIILDTVKEIGDDEKHSKVLDNLFESIKWHEFDWGNNSLDFYKIRSDERTDKTKDYTWEDLYIIAREKLKVHGGNVGDISGRFNSSQKPCLYLATQLPIAWEETREPSDFWFSTFSLEKFDIFKTIYLRSPKEYAQDIIAGEPREECSIEKYMEMLPVILACAIYNDDENKSEVYWFPQQLSRWISSSKYYGITYWTTRSKPYTISDFGGRYNIAIPVRNCKDNFRKDTEINEKMLMKTPHYCAIKKVVHMEVLKSAIEDVEKNNTLEEIRLNKDHRVLNVLKEAASNDISYFTLTIIQMVSRLIKENEITFKGIRYAKELKNSIEEVENKSQVFDFERDKEDSFLTIGEWMKKDNV